MGSSYPMFMSVFWSTMLLAGSVGTPLQARADVTSNESVPEFRTVVKKVLPAVVSIVAKPKEVSAEERKEQLDTMKKQIPPQFRKFFEEMDPEDLSRTPAQTGFGSGAIIDPKGIILTNNHVVEDAGAVIIQLQDGREFESSDIVQDPKSDVAVVRLKPGDAVDLPVAKLGDSSKMEIGDWVLAMGSPFGLRGSVTKGIISAKGRTLPANEIAGERRLMYQDFLQTDAAINPGNSGGPLVNLQGEIIGINTAIRSSTGQFGGIGFTIPANMAHKIVDHLVQHGRVKRSYLGIAMEPLNRKERDEYHLTGGITITRLYKDTPAGKAGLREKDVIVAVDGEPIDNMHALQEIVSFTPAGQTVQFQVLRDGSKVSVPVVLEEQPEQFGTEPVLVGADSPKERSAVGIEVLGLTITERKGQVLVAEVDPESPAAATEIEAGDQVLQVERKDVHSLAEFEETLKGLDAEKEGILVKIQKSDGRKMLVVLKGE